VVYFLFKLHDFLVVVDMAVDVEGTVGVGKSVVLHLGLIRGELLLSMLVAAHYLNYNDQSKLNEIIS